MLTPKRTIIVGAALIGVLWVYTQGSARPGDTSSPASSATGCRVTVTADVLNVRSAPAPDAGIVGKFKQGAETGADKVVQNGFRKLGENQWASTEFLKPLQGDCG